MTTIQSRRGTLFQWNAANPVLASGEVGFETDTGKHKIGDGTRTWSALPYFIDESGFSTVVNTVGSKLFVKTVSPFSHMAVGDGVTDDTTAIRDSVTDAGTALFGTVDLRGFTYKVIDHIDIPAGVKICNGVIHCTGAGKNLLNIVGDNVTIKDISLIGNNGTATAVNGENAINAVAPSAASPYQNLHIERVKINLFGKYAVYLQYINNFRVKNSDAKDIGYSGLTTLSCIGGVIDDYRITNVLASSTFSSNGYGIALSRDKVDSLVTDPRSADIKVINCTVTNVPWEGLDTHGGQNITFAHNHVLGCRRGIAVTEASNAANQAVFASLNVRVLNNFIDAQVNDGSAVEGISFTGAAGATSSDTAVEYATGSILSNTIRRHGDQANSNDGAIYARNTQGVLISGNTFDQPSNAAVLLYYDNRNVAFENNVIKDPWTNTSGVGRAAAVWTRSSNNSVHVDGNVIINTGAKTGSSYLCTDGITDSGSGTAITLGVNDFSAATSAVPLIARHVFNGYVDPQRTVRALAGSHGAPSYTFAADPASGLYQEAVNEVSLATNGVNRVRFITSGILVSEGYNFGFGTTTGTKFGTASTHKMGFWNKTPVVQPSGTPAAATDLATALTLINDLRTKLLNVGLIA